jgi:hypothetical protein
MKLLLITDDPAAEANLRGNLEEIADGGELAVKVAGAARERYGLPVSELSAR